MTLSLNETQKLVKDAARGSGLSWGEADELARVAVWLEIAGMDGAVQAVSALTDILDDHVSGVSLKRDTNWMLSPRETSSPPAISSLTAGVTARDLLATDGTTGDGRSRVSLKSVRSPVIAAGLLAGFVPATTQDLRIVVQAEHGAPGLTLIRRATSVYSAGACTAEPHDVEVELGPSDGDALPDTFSLIWSSDRHQEALERGVSPDERALEHLRKLAFNCLVPATEESRLKGAGAGTVDRD